MGIEIFTFKTRNMNWDGQAIAWLSDPVHAPKHAGYAGNTLWGNDFH